MNLFSGQSNGREMRYTREELQGFIDAIRAHGPRRGLTKWEGDFVESVAEQLSERGTLTDKQIDTLDRIYADRTPL